MGRGCDALARACTWGYSTAKRWWEPELGTAQGSVLSPLLGNVYVHYGLDLVV